MVILKTKHRVAIDVFIEHKKIYITSAYKKFFSKRERCKQAVVYVASHFNRIIVPITKEHEQRNK